MTVTTRLIGDVGPAASQRTWAGFQIGIRGTLAGYQNALVHPTGSVSAGVRADGKLFVGEHVSQTALPMDGTIRLTLTTDADGSTTLRRSGTGRLRPRHSKLIWMSTHWRATSRLAAHGSGSFDKIQWGFRDWRIGGTRVQAKSGQTFGPVLWTQYTLSQKVVRLTAALPTAG